MQLTHENTTFERKTFPITLVCDHLAFQQNMGSIFRIGEAFGVEKIIFVGKEILLNLRKINKTSRNTHLHIPYSPMEDTSTTIDYLIQNNYEIIALELANTSIAIEKTHLTTNSKIALIIGNEIAGVSESFLSASHQIVHIKMYGKNSSMNVAQATSIALYELTNKLNGY